MNKYDNLLITILRIIIGIELIIIITLTIMVIMFREKIPNQKNFLENKQNNEIIPVYPNDELIVKKYFADFSTLTFSEPDVAYTYISDYYKEKVYPTIDDFKNNIYNDVTDAFIGASIKSYQVTDYNQYRLFYIKDTNDHEYLIKEYGIMNYKIYLDTENVDINN